MATAAITDLRSAPRKMGLVTAAGGILLRPSGRRLQVATVHRPGRDDWSLPKGRLDPGESFEQTAVREVLEETGYRCTLDLFAGCTQYADRRGRPKLVAYWYMDPLAEGAFDLDPAPATDEVDEVRWMELTVARRALSYAHDRDLLRSVGGQAVALFG